MQALAEALTSPRGEAFIQAHYKGAGYASLLIRRRSFEGIHKPG